MSSEDLDSAVVRFFSKLPEVDAIYIEDLLEGRVHIWIFLDIELDNVEIYHRLEDAELELRERFSNIRYVDRLPKSMVKGYRDLLGTLPRVVYERKKE